MGVAGGRCLKDLLEESLPLDSRFDVHHLSTPPETCSAIYSAPPGQAPEKTYCESHFLSVSVISNQNQIQALALEVLIYSTEHLTTIFVSKADSTGYLHLVHFPKETPSPLKTISSTFLSFLIEKRRRSDRRLTLSLFARAQDQYLFPGSVENSHKHVLDDKGLIKWWCQVLDPIIQEYPSVHKELTPKSRPQVCSNFTSQGFLRVPGCDLRETRAFFPRNARYGTNQERQWSASDPLSNLRQSVDLPERCLIPRFPDDPKARYVDELDEELPGSSPQAQQNSFKSHNSGRWRSVKSLEQFWEMMAFRQECSSGRLVGFIWVVITPSLPPHHDIDKLNKQPLLASQCFSGTTPPNSIQSEVQDGPEYRDESPFRSGFSQDIPFSPSVPSTSKQEPVYVANDTTISKTISKKSKTFSGPIISRKPRQAKMQPEKTKFYLWPEPGRGELVLREKDYQRVHKLMLHLDYSNEEIATRSTKRWIDDVAVVGRVEKWGFSVQGKKQVHSVDQEFLESEANMLDLGLVRKKNKRANDNHNDTKDQIHEAKGQDINALPVNLVRKKPKMIHDCNKISIS